MARTNEKGTQLAELAIALPLLVFLCMAAIEGGSMLRVHQLVNNAAREGTRMAITQNVAYAGNRDSIVQTVVANYLSNNSALPGTGASFTLGECASWNPSTNVTTNWPIQSGSSSTPYQPASGAITGTLTLASGTTTNTLMTQVTVSCAYKFFFMPKLPGLQRQPTVTFKGKTTMMDLY